MHLFGFEMEESNGRFSEDMHPLPSEKKKGSTALYCSYYGKDFLRLPFVNQAEITRNENEHYITWIYIYIYIHTHTQEILHFKRQKPFAIYVFGICIFNFKKRQLKNTIKEKYSNCLITNKYWPINILSYAYIHLE